MVKKKAKLELTWIGKENRPGGPEPWGVSALPKSRAIRVNEAGGVMNDGVGPYG